MNHTFEGLMDTLGMVGEGVSEPDECQEKLAKQERKEESSKKEKIVNAIHRQAPTDRDVYSSFIHCCQDLEQPIYPSVGGGGAGVTPNRRLLLSGMTIELSSHDRTRQMHLPQWEKPI